MECDWFGSLQPTEQKINAHVCGWQSGIVIDLVICEKHSKTVNKINYTVGFWQMCCARARCCHIIGKRYISMFIFGECVCRLFFSCHFCRWYVAARDSTHNWYNSFFSSLIFASTFQLSQWAQLKCCNKLQMRNGKYRIKWVRKLPLRQFHFSFFLFRRCQLPAAIFICSGNCLVWCARRTQHTKFL